MSNFQRKIKREKEKEELNRIKELYKNKPKIKCPKCHKKTLFMKNDDGNLFCIRCEQQVK